MLNHITIMGRLARDPEIRYTQSQIPVANFTLAVERDFKDDKNQRGVDYIDCISWKSGAEFVQKYFHKGEMMIATGRIQQRKWKDKDGNNRNSFEVVTDSTYFVPKLSSEGAPVQPRLEELSDDDGELPF